MSIMNRIPTRQGPAQTGAANQATPANQANQAGRATAAVPVQAVAPTEAPLLLGMGPTQRHGSVDQQAFQVLKSALANTEVTPPDGMRPREPTEAPRPFEDVRNVAVPGDKKVKVADLGPQVFFEGRSRRSVDDVLKLWASTTHAHLWTTSVGKAMAQFAVDRYGQASLQFDRRGKIEHVVEVLNNADRIALDQQAHGQALDPKWREYLEYGALLHDIGYMNGGFMHPKKGGNDIMYHLKDTLAQHGADKGLLSDADLEKIALVVELHGDAFPWNMIGDDQDARRLSPGRGGGGFGDFPYLSLELVDQIFAQPGRTEQFVEIMKKENEVVIAEAEKDGRKALAWLDDPAQVRELIRTGYVMHAADKYKGPSAGMLENRKGKGKVGQSEPFTSLAALDNALRAKDLGGMIGGLAKALDQVVPATVSLEKDKDAQATLEQKILEPLYDQLGFVTALLTNVAQDVATSKSATLAGSLGEIVKSKAVTELDDGVNALPEGAQELLQQAVESIFRTKLSLGGVVKAAIGGVAAQVASAPDPKAEPASPAAR